MNRAEKYARLNRLEKWAHDRGELLMLKEGYGYEDIAAMQGMYDDYRQSYDEIMHPFKPEGFIYGDNPDAMSGGGPAGTPGINAAPYTGGWMGQKQGVM